MSKARSVANLLSGASGVVQFTGTGAVQVPGGTTAERPTGANGLLRYNSTLGYVENYTPNGWSSIASPPVVTSTNVNNVDESANTQTIVITGTNFDSGAYAVLVTPSSAVKTPTTSTRNSSSQITITYSGGDLLTSAVEEPLDIRVVNTSGLVSTLTGAIYIDATPVWVSPASGSVATIFENIAMSAVSLSATDSEGSSISYSITSGALPTGVSLSGSNISGTSTAGGAYASGGTTYNFTVTANDGTGNTSARAFSILRKWLDGATQSTAATSATSIKSITGTTTSGLFWLKPSGWSYPAQFYCEMNLHGGGWIYVMQRLCVGDNGLPGSWLNGVSGTQNHASSNFYGVTDSNGGSKSVMDIWDGFVGSSSLAKVYSREIQTSGGSYDESQRYVSSSDGVIYTRTAFTQLFYGNFVSAYAGSWMLNNIRVYYDNGASVVDGKYQTSWGAPSGVVTINNNAVDQNLFFCNSEDGGDSNWSFGLMKGGTPFPASANAGNGGGRNSTSRWGIMALKT
jgi:hypothetical protein